MEKTQTRDERNLRFETLQLHVGQEQADPATDARAVPIYQTSSYVFHDCQDAQDRFGLKAAGNIYGRLTNPTQAVFEQRIAALEKGTAALAVASGAAAICYTFQGLAGQGDHIVAANNIYGGTYNLLAHTLPEYGITTTFIDPARPGAYEEAIQENTKAVFIETLGNPNSDITDIEAAARSAHAHGIPLVIDNTFATPYLIRPIDTERTLLSTRRQNLSGDMGQPWAALLWKAAPLTGRHPADSRPLPSLTQATMRRIFRAAPGAAFVTKLRAITLRDMGATLSPFHAFLLLQGTGDPFPPGGAAM